MKAHTSRIIVVSDAKSSERDYLFCLLSDFDHVITIDLNDCNVLKKKDFNSPYSALILHLTNLNSSRKAALELLASAESIPVIGLFSLHQPDRDQAIISACDEVLDWPCTKQELNYRLQKNNDSCDVSQNMVHRLFLKLNIHGESPELLEVLEKVCKIIKCDAPVFIDGETGTGKELIARAIHYLGERKDKPFIAANCGAFPDQLVENEFFGHHKGAYTDARESVDGIIAQAEGGTLFLDEIETLSPKGQVALLRFLENMTYRPLGGKAVKTADIRIVTATNESISQLVETCGFRKDLYYRVNIMTIELPPLRKRRGDVNLLAEHFVRQYQLEYKQPEKKLHPNTLAALKYHDWPGNVRELENMIHREFLMADDEYIHINEIESMTCERRFNRRDRRLGDMFSQPMVEAKNTLINDFELQYLSATLDRANGNISKAARLAGKERRSFTRLLEKYDLDKTRYKTH